MGVGGMASTLDSLELSMEDIFDTDDTVNDNHSMDARRRLEDRIDELRLQRELRDFDYDI